MDNPVSQQKLVRLLVPLLRYGGGRYRKTSPVLARRASTGERVVTTTSSGIETENTANDGDFLVKNITIAEERYLVSGKAFAERYSLHRQVDEKWAEYSPQGEILALPVDSDIMQLLGSGSSFLIEAPWGNTQPVHTGDCFASPLPRLDQIYRIDKKEFLETYEPL